MKHMVLMFAVIAAGVLSAVEPPPFDIRKKPTTPEEKAQRKAYFEESRKAAQVFNN